jgi:hypothetical protein
MLRASVLGFCSFFILKKHLNKLMQTKCLKAHKSLKRQY